MTAPVDNPAQQAGTAICKILNWGDFFFFSFLHTKANQQGINFQISSSLISLCCAIKVHGVFSNKASGQPDENFYV